MEPRPASMDLQNPAVFAEWRDWLERNFPYSEKKNRELLTRTTRPRWGTEEELADLAGLGVDRDGVRTEAVRLAVQWFNGMDSIDNIEKESKSARASEKKEERARLIRLAYQVLDGKRNDPLTINAHDCFTGAPPENCRDDVIEDWFLLHKWTRAKLKNPQAPRPKLSLERAQERQLRADIDDIHGALG